MQPFVSHIETLSFIRSYLLDSSCRNEFLLLTMIENGHLRHTKSSPLKDCVPSVKLEDPAMAATEEYYFDKASIRRLMGLTQF